MVCPCTFSDIQGNTIPLYDFRRNDMKNKNTVTLVKPLEPSIEAYRRLGFTFKECDNPDFIEATLPEGWKAVGRNDGAVYTTVLFDIKNRIRAHSYDISPSYAHILGGHTGLFCKYSIKSVNISKTRKFRRFRIFRKFIKRKEYEIVVFENIPIINDETNPLYAKKIFSGGKSNCNLAYDRSTDRYCTEDPAVAKCINYMQLNFPDWQNPEAYWD